MEAQMPWAAPRGPGCPHVFPHTDPGIPGGSSSGSWSPWPCRALLRGHSVALPGWPASGRLFPLGNLMPGLTQLLGGAAGIKGSFFGWGAPILHASALVYLGTFFSDNLKEQKHLGTRAARPWSATPAGWRCGAWSGRDPGAEHPDLRARCCCRPWPSRSWCSVRWC